MNELLQYAVENGILDLRGVAEEVKVQKEREILSKHHIWKGKNGYYYSKINGKLLKRKELNDLNQAIIDLHAAAVPTVKDIFELFVENKRNVQPSTIARYQATFNSYLSIIKDKKINHITEYDLEELINELLDKGISAKEYGNLRTVLNGIFKLAKKKDLVKFRISETLEDLNVTYRDFKPKQHRKQVLDSKEYHLIIEYLKNNLDMLNLGLLLQLKTGLRVGELVALKPSDVGDCYISVTKTEQRVHDNYSIVETTKTEAGKRKVILAEQDLWLLRELRLRRSFNERLFDYSTNAVRHRLQNICDKLKIKRISPHKLRKTYASKLFSAGVDEQFICSQMGHTDIRTTKQYYIKDTLTLNEKKEMLKIVT